MTTDKDFWDMYDFEMNVDEKIPSPSYATEYRDLLQQLYPEYGSCELGWHLITREEVLDSMDDHPPGTMYLAGPEWFDNQLVQAFNDSVDRQTTDYFDDDVAPDDVAPASAPATPRRGRRRRAIDGLLRGFRLVLCCQ